MTKHNSSLCKQAELYYYNFLFNQNKESIPESILNHYTRCSLCSKQLDKLKNILAHIEENDVEQSKQISAAAAWLKHHFDYLGKPIKCANVKSFLPGFLDPELKNKIPTPISVHIDNCPQCKEDLEKIRDLNLSNKQLARLSSLLSEKQEVGTLNCSQAQATIPALVSMDFNKTTGDALKHLCICPDCIKQLYQYRETARNKYLNAAKRKEPKMFVCREISSSDYFDYVAPYGLDSGNNLNIRSFFTSHSSSCPICLSRMQQIHNIIFGIAERADSGITTIYHIKSIKDKNISEPELYDLPIKVEVLRPEDKFNVEQSDPPPVIPDNSERLNKSTLKIKPFFKIAAAIVFAAIITGLFLSISAVEAVTLENLYKAIEKVKHVHILSYIPSQKQPVQHQWVSRTLNVNIIKTGNESALLDVSNKVKKVRYLDDNSIQTIALTPEVINETQEMINDSFGLLPFHFISEIPKDAKWSHISNKDLEISDGIEVYDLIWIEKAFDSSKILKKWRVFVHSETTLPQKVEWYHKSDSDNEYVLDSIKTVKYIDDIEIEKVISSF